jgi:hypothetical protein
VTPRVPEHSWLDEAHCTLRRIQLHLQLHARPSDDDVSSLRWYVQSVPLRCRRLAMAHHLRRMEEQPVQVAHLKAALIPYTGLWTLAWLARLQPPYPATRERHCRRLIPRAPAAPRSAIVELGCALGRREEDGHPRWWQGCFGSRWPPDHGGRAYRETSIWSVRALQEG